MSADPMYAIRNLRKHYRVREENLTESIKGAFGIGVEHLRAVDDVSFEIEEGDIVGLAGQSGCGKSTLGELLVGLEEPTGGQIRFKGDNIDEFGTEELQRYRRQCQIIFQDPYASLNPRFPVSRTVGEPLKIHGIGDPEERNSRTIEALDDAGLRPPEKYLDKIPEELSGGERQRVSIARALVLDPDFIVADEPVSMLDVSVQTSVLSLFEQLQDQRDLTILYISHDLATINYLADKTMIMYQGNLIETGPTETVIHDPAHPYTETLLAAVPDPDPDVERRGTEMENEVPDPVDLPEGCRFEPFCEYATLECTEAEPQLEHLDGDRDVACYHPVPEENT